MGIIAWIVLGLGAGLLANMLIPGKRSQGLILTCVIGVAGALGGGWAATRLFHVHTLNGFFNLSTWLTAIAGAAVLLLIFHLIGPRRSRGPPAPAGSRTAEHRQHGAPQTAQHVPARPAAPVPGHPEPARRRAPGLPASVSNSDPWSTS